MSVRMTERVWPCADTHRRRSGGHSEVCIRFFRNPRLMARTDSYCAFDLRFRNLTLFHADLWPRKRLSIAVTLLPGASIVYDNQETALLGTCCLQHLTCLRLSNNRPGTVHLLDTTCCSKEVSRRLTARDSGNDLLQNFATDIGQLSHATGV